MGSLKVEAEIKVPGGPDCMDIHESGKQLWVTQRWIRAVSVVDLDAGKVMKRITVGRSPHGVYLHDRAGLL
jgi:DNA-binding beta-propeller fold protein YncE